MMAQRTISTKRERRQKAKRGRLEAERRARRRRALWTWAIPLGVVAVIGLVAVVTTRDGGEAPSTSAAVEIAGPLRTSPLQPGEAFPAFSASALGGGEVAWAPGRASLISIWAPWCPVCQAEMPMIDRVAREFPEVGAISMATAEDARPGPSIPEFVADRELKLPVALDDEAGTLARAMGIAGFPTTYLIDADGTVLAAVEGAVEEEALRQALRDVTDGS
jgi:thiol-disulfide isomerase/thioredoxin